MIEELTPYYNTDYGATYLGDALELLPKIGDETIDLICTSPPFPLLRKKAYGNVHSTEYVDWFMKFAKHYKRVLKKEGSLIVDLGGTWIKGSPTRSLYHYELLLQLCKPEEEGGLGLYLAQELYWYNPAKLPTPAEWVTVRRIRVKDAVNTVWWLSKDPFPKASNRGVLKPYSKAQLNLMKKGYKPKTRPSEHVISDKFGKNNKGSIPPNIINGTENPDNSMGGYVPVNVISASNTSSNDQYLKQCRANDIKPHPARFPKDLPKFAIGLCTEENDIVLDPFCGSNMTGYVAESMKRRWIGLDMEENYLNGSKFRFSKEMETSKNNEKITGDQLKMNI